MTDDAVRSGRPDNVLRGGKTFGIMSEQPTDYHDLDEDDQELGEESEGPRGWRAWLRNKKVIVLVGVVLVILIGAGTAPLFLAEEEEEITVVEIEPVRHHEFEEIWGDLKPTGRRAHYVKMTVVVEVPDDQALTRLNEMQVPIIDGFRTHLRDKTRSDLMGREGTEQLKADLLAIVNETIRPSKALRIYFHDLVTQ